MDSNYYDILQVDREATADEIQHAYWNLAKILHSDTGLDTADDERMKKLNVAYAVLSNPSKRRQYDRTLPCEPLPPPAPTRPSPTATPPPHASRPSPPPPGPGSSTFRPQENRGRLRVDGVDDYLFSSNDSDLADDNNFLSIGLMPLWLILGVLCVFAPPRISSLSFIQHPNGPLAGLAAMTVPLTCMAVFWVFGIPFCLYKVSEAFSKRHRD